MQNSQSRKDLLDRMVEQKALTSDGREWLTMAIDPFHDDERTLAGYPDSDGSQTIVSLRKYQTTITAPVGCVGNWDAHVFSMPLCRTTQFEKVTTNSPHHAELIGQAVPAFSWFSALNIRSNDAGVSMVPANPVLGHYEESVLPADGVYDLSQGNSRIVAMGYEIHNTTAEMHKQGTATTYRLPQYPTTTTVSYRNNGTTERAILSGMKLSTPPWNQAQAMVLKGTRTWDAAEGVYAPLALDSSHNPLAPDTVGHVILDSDSSQNNTVVYVQTNSATIVNAAPALSLYTPKIQKICPYDTTGTFLTGLSNETTLTVTLRVYVERAPSFYDADLAVLASPSAPYDVRALELYASTIGMMPVATKVMNNASGDWWRTALRVFGQAAETIGSSTMVVNPSGPYLGKGINQLLQSIADKKKKSSQERSLKDALATMNRVTTAVGALSKSQQRKNISDKLDKPPKAPRNRGGFP